MGGCFTLRKGKGKKGRELPQPFCNHLPARQPRPPLGDIPPSASLHVQKGRAEQGRITTQPGVIRHATVVPLRSMAPPHSQQRQAEEEVKSWGFQHVFTWSDGPYVPFSISFIPFTRFLPLFLSFMRVRSKTIGIFIASRNTRTVQCSAALAALFCFLFHPSIHPLHGHPLKHPRSVRGGCTR